MYSEISIVECLVSIFKWNNISIVFGFQEDTKIPLRKPRTKNVLKSIWQSNRECSLSESAWPLPPWYRCGGGANRVELQRVLKYRYLLDREWNSEPSANLVYPQVVLYYESWNKRRIASVKTLVWNIYVSENLPETFDEFRIMIADVVEITLQKTMMSIL